MVANIRLLAPLTRRQETQFATIKSPTDAVKYSNTIQLSPNLQGLNLLLDEINVINLNWISSLFIYPSEQPDFIILISISLIK